MTKEIEVKILEVNREKIEKTLKTLGAIKVFDGKIQTVFFDYSDGRIEAAKNVLRLRSKDGKTELTFKKVSSHIDAKIAEEYSIEVSNKEIACKILENLGLVAVECMDKQRISYKLGETNFDFDHYLGEFAYIPEFLEIEADGISKIQSYVHQIGYRPQDCLAWSTDELIRHYRKRKTVA